MILKGYINEVKEGGRLAKVTTSENEILNDVLLLHPYGESSNMEVDESSLVLLFFSLGSKTNAFGIPYNVLLQPSLEPQEKVVGNLKAGNKITFKANGDVEVVATNDLIETMINKTVTATTKITMTAPSIDLADAVGLILNDAAAMDVIIPGGSSAGTYAVNINSAGQTKVKA